MRTTEEVKCRISQNIWVIV